MILKQNLLKIKPLAVIFTFLFFFLLVILHFLDTSVTANRHFLSDFALGDYAYIFNIALISLSLGKILLVVILGKQAQQTILLKSIQVIILLSAISNFLIVIFPTENGPNISIIGQLHILFATLAFSFTGIFLALFSFWNLEKQQFKINLKRVVAVVYLLVLIYYPILENSDKPVAERILTILLTTGIILNTVLIKPN